MASISQKVGRIITYWILAVSAFAILFPVYWTITTSFKDPVDVFTYPPALIPYVQFKPTIDAWQRALIAPGAWWGLSLAAHGSGEVFHYLFNSAVVASLSSLLSVGLGSLAAYGLARFEFKRWKNRDIAFFVLSQRFLPPAVIVIPLFVLFKTLQMLDTYPALIIAHITMGLPFAVWIMREYFLETPKELEESAYIDGCSILQALRRIVIPIVAPGLISTIVLCFIFSWNEYLFALFLTQYNAMTIPALVAGATHSGAPLWWDIATMSTIAMIPPIIFALAVQKYIVRGLTFGAVKG